MANPETNKKHEARTTESNKVPFQQHPASKILEQLKANPRVRMIRIIVPTDACPVCRQVEGEYEKNEVPELPTLTCSKPHGCCAFYEPSLIEVYP
ncbi:MAG: hypothetical protein JXA25_03345 [Anaerolineales bacterium]|nr:hypothetical protein [Anaerolineales bacterium]